ncbi:uncharacterized protein LOC110108693 [Dendrobium catenatum]|uniref:Uncharacterized protein n=1 Tax=Dendrobium catenatum TaxID=906689 RepID=A0A2I0WUG9_9ASPA|nr:uncharacterized protein LOC110108693 [Dendrobium catenatum]PKU79308.1 hypothetical protein MA16_Dca000653 [Dendrobium catenatum]
MSSPSNFLAAAPNGDFKLRHWRSPAYLRIKEPAVPAAIDIPPEANSEPELSNWSPNSNIREGYTSIRDLIVSSPRSCVASPTYIGSEIQIRNPLVKQAVYTYLHLTPSSADSASSSTCDLSLRRLLVAISAAFGRCFGIIARLLCCASSGDLR